jgi:hypothetical protein
MLLAIGDDPAEDEWWCLSHAAGEGFEVGGLGYCARCGRMCCLWAGDACVHRRCLMGWARERREVTVSEERRLGAYGRRG